MSDQLALVPGYLTAHLQLSLVALAVGTGVSVPLGIWLTRRPSLEPGVLGVASVIQTIPSLALLAIMVPALAALGGLLAGLGVELRGIGYTPALIALSLYSVLPILRNTVAGLEDVDQAVIESAKGMGLNKSQRLVRIELPLAWPIILTGIRVATLLNLGISAIAPLVGGTGLGRYINDGLQRFPDVASVERMWTGVVFTIVLALIADLAFTLIRRLTTSKGIRS
ncbi:MAG: ABC transporter permease [Myxococcota bacterium]